MLPKFAIFYENTAEKPDDTLLCLIFHNERNGNRVKLLLLFSNYLC